MPVYQCYSPKGLLTKSAKAKIADEITAIHPNATEAPQLYVNVLFHEIPTSWRPGLSWPSPATNKGGSMRTAPGSPNWD